MDLKETQLSSSLVLDKSFIKVYEDKVSLPNGHQSKRLVIRHPGATCILAVTEHDEVILVRQWRYAVGKPLLELPAGKLDHKDEDPEACALRELAEETPYTAQKLTLIHTFYTAAGFCDEYMYLYLAEGLHKNSTLKNDEDELTQTVLMSRQEVQVAIKNNEINDAKTLIGLQYWLMNR